MSIRDIRSISIKEILSLFLIAVLVTCLFFDSVNQLADWLMPEKMVTITVENPERPGTGVWIFQLGDVEGDRDLFAMCRDGEQNGFWEYRDATTYGYAGNAVCSYGNNGGASISFSTQIKLNSYICVDKYIDRGILRIQTGSEAYTVDLYSEEYGLEYIYPFQYCLEPILVRISIYGLLFFLICVLLYSVYYVLISKERHIGFLATEIVWWDIFPVWTVLYIWANIQYKNGIPNFLNFGDQTYYWYRVPADLHIWNPESLAELTISFRGYLCNLFPVVSQIIGRALHLEPVLVYFLFTSFAIAWLVTYVLPEIYHLLTDRRGILLQILISMVVYLFFWNGTLTAVLVDLFGAVSFLSGIMYALKFWKTRSYFFAVLMGVTWAAACNYRTAYQYGILATLVITGGAFFVREIKGMHRKIPIGRRPIKSLVGGVVLSACGFFLVSFPQLQINLAKGHTGILPYDYVGAWAIEGAPRAVSVLETNANNCWTYGYTGYPHAVADDLLLTMKTQLYESGAVLTMPQIIGIHANNPLETLVYIGKKLFLAFDPKTNITYPDKIIWRESSGLVFSALNYFVLWSALYIILFGSNVRRGERILFSVFVVGLILPQMMIHVEWRYFLSSYILLYYFFSYHFIGEVVLSREACTQLVRKNYLLWIALSVFLSFSLSLTVYA